MIGRVQGEHYWGSTSTFIEPVRLPQMNNNIVGNLVLTQILALCFTISATLCQLMRRDYDLDLSALQMTLMYLLVAIIFWLALIHLSVDYFWKRKFSTGRLSLTLVISIFDCAGSIFSLHSFSYLSVPVVSLLSNLSTPTVMIFSWLLLGAKYRWNNYVGAASAILGVVLLTVVQNNLSLASGQNSSRISDFIYWIGFYWFTFSFWHLFDYFVGCLLWNF